MLNLNSAPLRYETPHSTNGSRVTISDALKRRAQAIINDRSTDAPTRAIIRYGLEINDPSLPELIRCTDNGESILENIYVASSEEKIEALTDLICREIALRVIKIGEILFRIPSVQSGKRVIANRIFEIQYRIGEILLAIWKSAIIPTAIPDRIGATPDSGRRIPEG